MTVVLGCFLLVNYQAVSNNFQPKTQLPAFEAASIVPVKDADVPYRPRPPMLVPPGAIPMSSPGRIDLRGRSFQELVALAYRVRVSQVSGPGWIRGAFFNLVAKLPDREHRGQVNEMIQSLLVERFGLRVHHESKDVAGYALVVDKSGSKLAQLGSHIEEPSDKKAVSVGSKKGMVSGSTDIQEMSLPVLAKAISRYLDRPVIDASGLDGTYTFTIDTYRDPQESPDASLREALKKLGLKLEPRRVQADFIIIDTSSSVPIENVP